MRKMQEEPYLVEGVADERDLVRNALSITDVYGIGGNMMREGWIYRRGDIYLANLGKPSGSQQGSVRPVVVLQNGVGNFYAPTITIVLLTSKF